MPRAPGLATLAALAAVAAAPGVARAEDDFDGASVIFARGASLYQVDATGKGETEIARLTPPAPPPPPRGRGARGPRRRPDPPPTVRALRSDADGTVLLVDLAGKWAWLPLDGSTTALTELPCGDGPAQLAEDGSAVLCRSATVAGQSILIELRPVPRPARTGPGVPDGTSTMVDIPPGAARLAGVGGERKLVWADASGVWMAPPGDPRHKARVASGAPLRGFLPSPDGGRAIGVYADQIYADAHHTRASEVLMTVQLDGAGARRKAIRDGVVVEWSHDSQWLLVQDGASACIMRASGGQYKCWKNFTAASLSSDGRWGLVLGNRNGPTRQTHKPAPRPPARRPKPRPASPVEPGDKPWDHIDEPSDEPEAGNEPSANDDVSVAPPSGPLSLYRVRLEGAYTDRPALLVKVIDGAAVWVPRAP